MDIDEEKFFDELMNKEKLRARPTNATETKDAEPSNNSHAQSIGNIRLKVQLCVKLILN